MRAPSVVTISVWSDYVCPFCYLEEPVLQRLQAEEGDRLQVEWRAFELRPEPVPTLEPGGEYLRATWARAVYPMAEERGLTLRLPPVQPRSRRAHEAAAFAREHGRFEAMHTALFRAFFEDGRDIGSLNELVAIGAGVGLGVQALYEALRAGRYTARVREDQRLAMALQLSSVPMLLIRRSGEALGQAQAMPGAHPYESVRQAVDWVREAA